MRHYSFVNVDEARVGGMDILFPDWEGDKERLCVYSPHDDDAILGAGYAMRAALDAGAEVHVFIVCSGDAGYSTVEEKDTIVETRKRETIRCYEQFGIPEKNIVFLDFPDFSAIQYVGRSIVPDREGHFRRSITELRTRRITRMLVPNHYHEHIDHLASYLIASFDAPQVGDVIAVDWAAPYAIKSVAQYSVWANLDPEDALVKGRDSALRANTLLLANAEVEEAVFDGISQYVSQQQIISDLVRQRQSRRTDDGRMLEVFIRFDPRPSLDYAPYKKYLIEKGL